MATLRLDFLNKNMYRKYPIKATSKHIFTNGVELPQSLITSAQVSTTYGYHKVYVSQIYIKKTYVNVTFKDYDSGLLLGSCGGYIISDQTVLQITSFVDFFAGSITIGTTKQVENYDGMYFLNPSDGLLEDTTVFCFTPPGVTSITNNGNIAYGKVILATNNIILLETTDHITLNVINTAIIESHNDISGTLSNCPTPIIKQINSVFPDSSSNIDIFGILPVSVSVTDDQISMTTVSPILELADICPELNQTIPPTNNSNVYYTDILTTTTPEWKTWPEFE